MQHKILSNRAKAPILWSELIWTVTNNNINNNSNVWTIGLQFKNTKVNKTTLTYVLWKGRMINRKLIQWKYIAEYTYSTQSHQRKVIFYAYHCDFPRATPLQCCSHNSTRGPPTELYGIQWAHRLSHRQTSQLTLLSSARTHHRRRASTGNVTGETSAVERRLYRLLQSPSNFPAKALETINVKNCKFKT